MNEEQRKIIIQTIEEEAKRIQYGKVVIEVSVFGGIIKMLSADTKRTVDLKAKETVV